MLEIKTLGGLSIRRDGAQVPAFASRKANALLVYLSYTQCEHPREVLADFLWDESSAGDKLANLRTVISSLRRHCGPYITVGRYSVGMGDPDTIWLDTVALENNLVEARLQPGLAETALRHAMVHVEKALDLYKGDFLAGFSTRNSVSFEEWLRVERDELRSRMIEALRQIIPQYISIPQETYSKALHHASKLIQFDPLNEEAHRQFMVLLARDGRRKEALQHFEVCRSLLEQELGIQPSPETVQLREEIERASVRTSFHRSPQHNLPAILPLMVGRERELAELTNLLSNPRCRLITLFGPGGVGKTCMALHAATRHIDVLRHGVYFVQMASISSLDQLVASMQHMLRLDAPDRQPSRSTLIQYLADRELLLVIDELEHPRHAEELIADIVQHAPGVKLLVTSRASLRLHEAWACKLSGLAYPAEDTASGPIEQYGAIQMFLDIARRITGQTVWSDQEKRAIANICRMVDGLPLAIEHAASWLRILSCQDIAGELDKNLDLLTTTFQDMPAEHQSMRAILDASWGMLSVEEQIAIHRLSGLRGSFKREEAANTVGVTLGVLSALIEKSVVNRNSEGDYQLANLLRRYVRQKYWDAANSADND